MLAFLKKRSAHDRARKLYLSVLNSQPNNVKKLLKEGDDPNLYYSDSERRKALGKQYDKFPKLLLTCAYNNNDTNMVKLLVDYNANIDLPESNREKITILMRAARDNKQEMLEIILKYTANIDNQDWEGNTALTHAVLYNNTIAARLLLRYGAKINLTDTFKNTAFNYAINNFNQNMIYEMIMHTIASASQTQIDYLREIFKQGVGINITQNFKKNLKDYITDNYEHISPIALLNNTNSSANSIGLLFAAYIVVIKNNIEATKNELNHPKQNIDGFFCDKVNELFSGIPNTELWTPTPSQRKKYNKKM